MADTTVAPRTAMELAILKAQWKADPCWDIEETEGFEAHRHELHVFRLETELRSARSVAAEAEQYGVSLSGLSVLKDLERRVSKLEADRG